MELSDDTVAEGFYFDKYGVGGLEEFPHGGIFFQVELDPRFPFGVCDFFGDSVHCDCHGCGYVFYLVAAVVDEQGHAAIIADVGEFLCGAGSGEVEPFQVMSGGEGDQAGVRAAVPCGGQHHEVLAVEQFPQRLFDVFDVIHVIVLPGLVFNIKSGC